MTAQPQHPALSRRDLMQIGSLGLLGLSLSDLHHLQAAGEFDEPEFDTASYPQAKSVIFIFLGGGLSQLDSFDMKPLSPAEIRGDFRPMATQTTGIDICEHLPRLAACSATWSMVRSLTHKEQAHGPACHSMLSGRTELPAGSPGGCGAPPTPRDWPSLASLTTYAVAGRNNLPPAIVLPARLNPSALRPGVLAGRLGSKYDPWLIEPCNVTISGCLPNGFDWKLGDEGGWHVVPTQPERPDFFRPPSLVLPEEINPARFSHRMSLLDDIERQRQSLDRLAASGDFDKYRDRAVSLLTGESTRNALFDVMNAAPEEQDRYGRHEWGWDLLMARRLIEAGVPLVQVTLGRNGCWDTHRDNFRLLKDFLFAPFDQALSALLLDLSERGLLNETLIVVAGEFGRSPKIVQHEQGKSQPGRDHWAGVQTVLLAGGGVAGGRVIGASDKIGGAPADRPVTPENLAATIFHALGIPRRTIWHEEQDAASRTNPQPLYYGRPIDGLV